jgi:hypothetical protein
MNSKRTFARDRRIAAVHEAGHLVIAMRLGFEIASAWIVPNKGEPDARMKQMKSPAGWLAWPAQLPSIYGSADGSRTFFRTQYRIAIGIWPGVPRMSPMTR